MLPASGKPPLAFPAVCDIVRRIPNHPKRFRSVLAYWIAKHDVRGHWIASVGHGVQLNLQLDDWLQRLYALGEADQERRAILQSFVPVGGTFIDVGANVGLYTCSLASHVGPRGRVVAFEPLPINLRALEANVALNGLQNVTVHGTALSNREEEIQLSAPAHILGERGRATSRNLDRGIFLASVRCTSLDVVFQGDRLDAMKLDVEGHELRVLEGASKTIRRFRPFIQCEVLFDGVLDGVLALARELRYHVFQEGRRGGLAPFDPRTPAPELFLVPPSR